MLADPLPLMVRYLAGNEPELTSDEREILLFALYCESRERKGLAVAGIGALVQSGRAVNPPHYYVSTYCLHADHEQCRKTCKTCDAPCRCACHTEAAKDYAL